MILLLFGSDELWNLANPSFTHRIEYLGYSLGCNHIIAYAPSCNNTTVEYFEEYYEGKKVDFSNFDRLSARDKNTKILLEAKTGNQVEYVLDPTLLIESFDKFTKESKIKEKYILIYGYHFIEEEKRKIINFAKSQKLPIYSIGFNHEWADKVIFGEIGDFLYYMKNASYVITNTFHGTIYAMIYEKKFVTFAKNNHKIHHILEFFDLKYKNFTQKDEITEFEINNIDYEAINAIKERERIKSLKFLKQAIECSEEIYERSLVI